MNASPPEAVGIFWFVMEGDQTRGIADKTPLHLAETYGDFLTFPVGHYDHWAALQRLPAHTLQRWLRITAPLHHEYENWPRRRIVLHRPSNHFIIYAAAQLHHPSFIAQICLTFDLLDEACDVRLDAHYSRTLRLRPPPAKPP